MDYTPAVLAEAMPGQLLVCTAVVSDFTLRPFTNKPGSFLSLTLQDKTGTLPAVLWDEAESVAPALSVGVVVRAKGQVSTYRGQLQLKLDSLEVLAPSEYDASLLVPALPDEARRANEAELERLVSSVQSPPLQRLLRRMLFEDEKLASAFREAPGARRVHHAYLGGLLKHTLEVCKLCLAACEVHPELDRDLLVTGALLHDVGKVLEYSWDTAFGTTAAGELIGHTVLGYSLVRDAALALGDFPEDLLLRLEHMLLSHHGQLEFGAPVVPKTREALALHFLEHYDSQAEQFNRLSAEALAQGEEWSDYDRVLGRRVFAPDDSSRRAES